MYSCSFYDIISHEIYGPKFQEVLDSEYGYFLKSKENFYSKRHYLMELGVPVTNIGTTDKELSDWFEELKKALIADNQKNPLDLYDIILDDLYSDLFQKILESNQGYYLKSKETIEEKESFIEQIGVRTKHIGNTEEDVKSWLSELAEALNDYDLGLAEACRESCSNLIMECYWTLREFIQKNGRCGIGYVFYESFGGGEKALCFESGDSIYLGDDANIEEIKNQIDKLYVVALEAGYKILTSEEGLQWYKDHQF